MKEILSSLNKSFDSRVRVGIMSILLRSNWVDFTTIRNTLGATDGNISNHLSALQKHNMIKTKKEFVSNRPKTSYKITRQGIRKFTDHLSVFEKLLSS
ncbi:MAG: transcriptional regulator [Bacteroidetes bacterium]|nr:transcriptional regulator [Bacteroidota bacterium]